MIPIWLVWAAFLYGFQVNVRVFLFLTIKASYYLFKRRILTFVIYSLFQISILVSSLIDGNIGSFIFNLALLALSLYSGLIIISYRYCFMNNLVFMFI